jgi:hypothetical protein
MTDLTITTETVTPATLGAIAWVTEITDLDLDEALHDAYDADWETARSSNFEDMGSAWRDVVIEAMLEEAPAGLEWAVQAGLATVDWSEVLGDWEEKAGY